MQGVGNFNRITRAREQAFYADAATRLRYWNSADNSWRVVVGATAQAFLDSINGYEYFESKIPFYDLGGYDTTRSFRYLVVCQQENTNDSWNVFPTKNQPGKDGKTPARYPYYYEVTDGLRSGLEPAAVSRPLAVELSQFAAMDRNGAVELTWRTESETDNYQWLIDRSDNPDDGYQRIATVPGQGSTPSGHSYSYTDNSVLPGLTYYYLLGDQDFNDKITWHGPVSVATGGQLLVGGFGIDCHPNPAKVAALIVYSLNKPSLVELSIYDAAGRLVRRFEKQRLGVGRHSTPWNCTDQGGLKVASGVYFFRLATDGGDVITGRVAVIR
jgi:hypothetical protein